MNNHYIDGSLQNLGNSSALAMKFLQFYTKPSIYTKNSIYNINFMPTR